MHLKEIWKHTDLDSYVLTSCLVGVMYLTSISLSFLICTMDVLRPASQGSWEYWWQCMESVKQSARHILCTE